MKRSNRLILLIGVVLAVATFAGIVLLFQGNRGVSGAPTVPQDLPTVFATRDITLGTEVTTDMLEVRQQAVTGRDATAFGSDSLVVGQIARKNIAAGKQLTGDDFDVTGAPLAIDTPAGARAMAVQVDQVSGVGTLIRTGDYVDVIVSVTADRFPLALPGTIGALDPGVYNETSAKILAQGIQVIGTLLPPPPAAAEGAEGQPADGGTALTGQQEIVILSVTAEQAEIIKFAQVDGSITLALRSPNDFRDANGEPIDATVEETQGVTLRALVERYGVLVPQLVDVPLDPGVNVATP